MWSMAGAGSEFSAPGIVSPVEALASHFFAPTELVQKKCAVAALKLGCPRNFEALKYPLNEHFIVEV